MVEISTSILGVDKENCLQKFYDLEVAKTDYFHIDVMDGKFVKRNTLDLMREFVRQIKNISNALLDVHLMVENVKEMVDEYIPFEPNIITFHLEAVKNKDEVIKLINYIKGNNIKVGIAIKPETGIENVLEYLPYIHMCLIMTVEPGEGGQELIKETLVKVYALKEYINENNLDTCIETDGGINDKTARAVKVAGSDILVSGSYITKSDGFKEKIEQLKKV